LLTFGSVNYASTAGGYAAVTKGLITFDFWFRYYVYVCVYVCFWGWIKDEYNIIT